MEKIVLNQDGTLSKAYSNMTSGKEDAGQCPWPFVCFHDPKTGMKDFQTWIVIWLVLSFAWSYCQNVLGWIWSVWNGRKIDLYGHSVTGVKFYCVCNSKMIIYCRNVLLSEEFGIYSIIKNSFGGWRKVSFLKDFWRMCTDSCHCYWCSCCTDLSSSFCEHIAWEELTLDFPCHYTTAVKYFMPPCTSPISSSAENIVLQQKWFFW